MTVHEVQALLAFSHLYDIDILMRPPTLEKKTWERTPGASGIFSHWAHFNS